MNKKILIARILFTISTLQLLLPLFRDGGESHMQNSEWVAHARLHMAWALIFSFASGVANIYFIWFKKPFTNWNLYTCFIWQVCHLSGFWIASIFASSYGGSIYNSKFHLTILGVNENVFVFSVFSILSLVGFFYTRLNLREEDNTTQISNVASLY